MITKINVVYHKGTKLTVPTEHVFAAMVRTAAPPGSEPTIEQLTNPALLVRGWSGSPPAELIFHVSPNELGTAVPLVDDAVREVQGNPRGFRLEDGKLKKLSADSVHASNTKVVANKIHVVVSAVVTEETPVWVQIEGGTIPESDPLNLNGKIEPSGTSTPTGKSADIEISPPLGSGSYRVLILVKDRPLFFMTKVIP